MTTQSRVVAYLRIHCQPCGFEGLTQDVRALFPAPDDSLLKAKFYVADARKRCYFAFIEKSGTAGGAGLSHEGNIVLVQGEEVITLISCRGGAGDIWESFMLPVEKVEYVGFRTRTGRR